MSQERDDKWLRDIYIHYIDMLAKLLERNLLKAIISVTDLDQKCLFVLQASGIIRSSMVVWFLLLRLFSSNHSVCINAALWPEARQ